MIGRTLRQYLIAAKLGEGGMGVVWKARDTSLDRDVALKLLPADVSGDPSRKERFVREAKAASALNHPNIITIYEINADQGVDFIAMEYVPGETLADRLTRGPLTVDEVVDIARQIAEGVGRAHSAGIVHRDLKPGNIMITADGLVKVLDFGLAKFDEAMQPRDPATDFATRMVVTRPGAAMGTVGYMSPEQALGDRVDARSDVFSFGVILHKMLTNELPFSGDTQAALLHKLHFSEPPPIQAVRPDAPPFLTSIAQRALAKKPEDRFFTLSAVAAALRNREKVEVAAPTTVTATVSGGWPLAWVAISAVIMLAAGAAVWTAYRDVSPQPAAAIAATNASPFELSQQAAALLARDDRDGNIDRAISLLGGAVEQDSSNALAHAQLADAYRRKHRNTPDPQWVKLARDTAQRAFELNPDLAASHIALGWVQLADGQGQQSAAEFGRAAELDPLNAQPHLGLAMTFASASRDAEAEASFRQAISLAPDDWRLHFELGDFAFKRARYADAAASWDTVRRMTPDNVLGLRNLGAAYYQLGRADEAASALQRALEIQPAAAIYTNLGTIRFFQGRYTDAVPAFEKAVELAATRHINWANLGDGLRWAPGRRPEAAAAYRRASELIAEQIAQRPADPDLRTRHAMYLMKMGDRPAAMQEIGQIPADARLTAQMLYRLTMVYELAGDRVQALATLERALKAGYPKAELNNEPEFIALRSDARYQRLIGQF